MTEILMEKALQILFGELEKMPVYKLSEGNRKYRTQWGKDL